MAIVKTAISIEKPLFEEIDALAEEMDVSRSYLFSLAVRDFIEQHRNRKLLDALNAAYDEQAEPEEVKLRAGMKAKYRSLNKEQW